MQIRILKNTVASRQSVKIGQVIEVPENEGKFLVSIGKAEKYKGEPEKEPEPIHEAPKRRKFEGRK